MIGILAGLASGFFNHPMDTIKLRIQTISDDFDAMSPKTDNFSGNQSPGTDNNNFNKNNNFDNHSQGGGKNNSHNDYNNNNNNDNYNHNQNRHENYEKNYKYQSGSNYKNNDYNNNNYDDNYEKNSRKDKDSEKKTNKKKRIEYNLISMGMLMVRKEGISTLFSGLGAAMYSTIFSSAFFCIIYEMIKRQSTVQ